MQHAKIEVPAVSWGVERQVSVDAQKKFTKI